MKLQLHALLLILPAYALEPLVHTSTGPIAGSKVSSDVLAWKGIPFTVPPIGKKRWTPPVLNKWTHVKNTTALGPACIQDLDGDDPLYNNPPLAEDEDCLTINVWAPSKPAKTPRAILFWIFGNGFQYGGSGTVFYDGTSFAEEQDVILVSHNYRTNLFGFPNSPELPLRERNLALLDQQLALAWTRDNAAKFGGDPNKITLFGQSAGSGSVALLIEHFHKNPPFHGAILQSGVRDALNNNLGTAPANSSSWDSVAAHFECPLTNGIAQLACMRNISATALKEFIINDTSLDFGPLPDGGITVPDKPTQTLESGAVAQVPIMIGDNAQGGSFLVGNQDNFTAFISQPPWNSLSPDKLRALYPVPEKFASDLEAIIALATDEQYRCPSAMFSNIFINHSRTTVHRYVYGAVLPQFQVFPDAGTIEGSELPLVFGNLDFLNATMNSTQVALSKTLQTIWANFAKNPSKAPAPNWPPYTPYDKKVAALAFGANVNLEDVVDVRNASSFDGACSLLDTLVL